mmetsp:Transcript_9264/g.13447  ORF Transcript_9264/g.13447 Transcript_9264/m.13447 type:complete len:82 (+) Transcript_9264:915-1160(+)
MLFHFQKGSQLCKGARSVWHKGFMDAAAADEIAKDIERVSRRLLGMEQTNTKNTTTILALQSELLYLKKQYEEKSGEPFDN